ncbi:cadmium resistance transporter [Pantanalinema rosaneae CENA516]|uniref:cadmium resistance transporter n=1 Tax=Pantanalinema rosaneae TaxID=1620701 RepID=UPI003D6F0F2C
MMQFLTALSTGLTVFVATNMDDIIILLLLFSQVNGGLRRRQIVTGQYLGFGALVLASLPGFFGSLVFPRPWLGMLGMIPIAIGISRLLTQEPEEAVDDVVLETSQGAFLASVLSPQTYSVAAITFANGGDNIGIYVPVFASHRLPGLLVILATFFLLVGVWCYAADRLTRLPLIAHTLAHYGHQLVPFGLIGLGGLILVNSHTLADRGLTVLTLVLCGFCLLAFNRNQSPAATTESEEN